MLATHAFAATDVRVNFTLNTTDENGAPLAENRSYFVYRPDNLSKAAPAPMLLVMEGGAATQFHRKADQAGFVVASCTFTGNSLGTVWNNDNPRITGFEDYDYVSAVIARVVAAENCHDVFICGLSKGGHMSYAFACERPAQIKAACSVDEFMGLTSNIPFAPVPILALHGTLDTNVSYTMGRDSVDAWRAFNGLMSATPVTTFESSPLQPGRVTQTTWRSPGAPPVALVTIIGGDHRWPLPGVQTGYDSTDGLWAFFSQFLTSAQPAPKIVSHPVNHTEIAGQRASFWVSATGDPPLRYQWQKNGVDVPGATANWFTLPATTAADNGAVIRAIATNGAGTATSNAATLTVTAAPADPVISAQPADQTVTAGRPGSFSVSATGSGTLQYQWRKNGMNLAGATAATLAVPAALTSDCGGTFSVVVSTAAGNVTSAPATLTVLPAAGGPIILTHPERARVLAGSTGTFNVSAWSPTPLTYQWQQGTFTAVMVDIPGATNARYITPATALSDHLTVVRCVVSNAAGSTTCASEMLFVTSAVAKPTDLTSAIRAYATPGAPFSFTATASGGTAPVRFAARGLPEGLSIDAATGAISGTPLGEGVWPVTLTASNPAGSTSARLTLTVKPTPASWGRERLANLATRGLVGTGENNLIAGFVVQGTAPKRVLVRAVGPTLASFGVPGALADPRLTLIDGRGQPVMSVDDWNPAGPVAALAASVGAFELSAGSKDAAAVATLEPDNYTVRVEGSAGAATGVALIEVYDADAAGSASQQINLSTRGLAGRDGNQMIAGFVIAGTEARSVLIRAIGGATLGAFGLAGGLGDPALEVYDSSGDRVAANDDWGRSPDAPFLPQAFSSVGAFPLASASKDAAVLITLPPGAYTAKVANRDQPDGVALVEIYEAPAPPGPGAF